MFNFLIEEICAKGSPMLYIFQICRWVIRIMQIAVPFVLIIFGSLDFFKALMANDEKAMREKRKPFITRIIASIIIIFLPTLVNILLKKIAVNTNNRFAVCWDLAGDYSNSNMYSNDGNVFGNEEDNSDSSEQTGNSKIDKLKGGTDVIITSGEGKGQTGVIVSVNKDENTVRVVLNDKREITTSVDNIEIKESTKTTDASLSGRYKKGDKVEIISGEGIGIVGEIVDVNKENLVKVQYNEKVYNTSSTRLDVLKTGDMVKIIKGENLGKIGKITKILTYNGITLNITCLDGKEVSTERENGNKKDVVEKVTSTDNITNSVWVSVDDIEKVH